MALGKSLFWKASLAVVKGSGEEAYRKRGRKGRRKGRKCLKEGIGKEEDELVG